MKLALTPLRHWPWPIHLAAAAFLIAGVAVAAALAIAAARTTLETHQSAIEHAKSELRSLQQSPARAKPDFAAQLPPPQRVDAVVQDVGRLAQELGVEVRSLTLQPVKATPQELGKIQLAVAATGDYKSVKAWLGELLARHGFLGVEAMALRSAGADSARVEIQASLVLFVRD